MNYKILFLTVSLFIIGSCGPISKEEQKQRMIQEVTEAIEGMRDHISACKINSSHFDIKICREHFQSGTRDILNTELPACIEGGAEADAAVCEQSLQATFSLFETWLQARTVDQKGTNKGELTADLRDKGELTADLRDPLDHRSDRDKLVTSDSKEKSEEDRIAEMAEEFQPVFYLDHGLPSNETARQTEEIVGTNADIKLKTGLAESPPNQKSWLDYADKKLDSADDQASLFSDTVVLSKTWLQAVAKAKSEIIEASQLAEDLSNREQSDVLDVNPAAELAESLRPIHGQSGGSTSIDILNDGGSPEDASP